MAKAGFISIRVDDQTKTRLEGAARARGQSLTTFLLSAAECAARGRDLSAAFDPAGNPLPKPKGRGPCPTFFLARCYGASKGGADGY
jgi:hypothetical protein